MLGIDRQTARKEVAILEVRQTRFPGKGSIVETPAAIVTPPWGQG
jgi:hypothetical protein